MSRARPKVADGVIVGASVCLLGAAEVIPQHAHILSEVLFYSGLAIVVGYPLIRWGRWALGLIRGNPADAQTLDVNSGTFSGRDNTGVQQVFNAPVTVHNAPSREDWLPPASTGIVLGPNSKGATIGKAEVYGFERAIHDEGTNTKVESVQATGPIAPPVQLPERRSTSLVHLGGVGVKGNINLTNNIGIGMDHLVTMDSGFKLEGDITGDRNFISSHRPAPPVPEILVSLHDAARLLHAGIEANAVQPLGQCTEEALEKWKSVLLQSELEILAIQPPSTKPLPLRNEKAVLTPLGANRIQSHVGYATYVYDGAAVRKDALEWFIASYVEKLKSRK